MNYLARIWAGSIGYNLAARKKNSGSNWAQWAPVVRTQGPAVKVNFISVSNFAGGKVEVIRGPTHVWAQLTVLQSVPGSLILLF